jgi:hypothetical protein
MTNSSNSNPNNTPHRRRRLTADELIAIIVALTGIGSVLFWGLGQKNNPINLLQTNPLALNGQSVNPGGGLLAENSDTQVARRDKIATQPGQTHTNPELNNPSSGTVNPQNTNKIPAYPALPLPIEDKTTADPIAKAPTTTAPVLPAATAPSPANAGTQFKDVPQAFWGGTYISELQKRGILDDFAAGGTFDPNKPITRGEYAKILDRAFGNRRIEDRKVAFKDIPTNYPRKEAIDKSVKLGFMSGYSPNKFAPNEEIPRYQMQISLAKGLNLPIPANPDQILSKFSDAEKMPKYAREKMSAAITAGLVVKDEQPNTLKPIQNATRADAAALIYESLVKEGVIQPQP